MSKMGVSMLRVPSNKSRASPFSSPELRFAGSNSKHADAIEALAGMEKIEMEGTLMAVDESEMHTGAGAISDCNF